MCAWVTAGCCPCCLIVARGFGFVYTTLLRQGVVRGVVCSFGGSGGAGCRPRRCLWVSSKASSEFGRSQVWIRIFFCGHVFTQWRGAWLIFQLSHTKSEHFSAQFQPEKSIDESSHQSEPKRCSFEAIGLRCLTKSVVRSKLSDISPWLTMWKLQAVREPILLLWVCSIHGKRGFTFSIASPQKGFQKSSTNTECGQRQHRATLDGTKQAIARTAQDSSASAAATAFSF